ncbi:MAG: ribbon-helix-helix domain-containing protein [Desulfurivibrionaceae bacterium]|jgi:metal-responsive CopG/Arc/MetJ family transcriptional regulator
MPGVKTAISLDEKLFDKVNKLANELHVSRSRLFTLAVKDYLKKQENQTLLAQLNDAYADHPDQEERKISSAMKSKHGKIMEQEPW